MNEQADTPVALGEGGAKPLIQPSMRQPDFSRYSEAQLRHIAQRIDRERFPERAEEIARRIAAFEQGDSLEPVPPSPELGAERTRISSDFARFGFAMFPFFWFGILLLFAIELLASKNSSAGNWLILACFALVGMLGQCKIVGMASTVDLAGTCLIACRGGTEHIVRLADVDRVEVSNDETVTVVVHFLRDTSIGLKFEFVPAQETGWKLWAQNRAVAELTRQVKLAKAAP